ncbi:hypothetical protein B0H67DRAFT_494065 [Lasiosphaeris hirsuta]|uniref:NAD(P)-binding protein n=1 Tax=Lasiosphaeris hirsuta TaxID=260670 RepID=A0AA40DNX5_9PEZI|nr:hypothetical protein B0H67DRAFT_494065 [Lasiosphaeris hirsuta]
MSSYAVTGTSRGLGLEFVRQLSQNPQNTVFAIARTPEAATDLKALAEERANVHIIKADVTDPNSLLAAAAAVSKITNGSLDVLINNAVTFNYASVGLTPSQIPVDEEATREIFKSSIDSSLFGAIWTTNAFLPLIENGRGKKIIHLTTGMADLLLIKGAGVAYTVDYSAGKGAMNVVVAKYAVELAPRGIKVGAISPGWVDTYEGPLPKSDMIIGFTQSMLESFQKIYPELKGQIQKEDSVRMMLETIDNLTEEQSGLVISHHGNQDWF